MAASSTTRKLVATLGATRRHHPDADTTDIRRELAASTIEDHVRAVVAQAPPLTDEQRERIAALLRAGGAA
ncbi:hypothetical protein ACWELP_24975 [Rhodococcus aetherivorans]